MRTYEFSIIASGLDPDAEDFESRFYEVGCDDATVSFQKGHIILDFARQATSVEAAIGSAVDAVRLAGAIVDRVEPDPLVSLSEIASRTGLTRAAITHYSKGQRGKDFPTPIAKVTSESPLWDWAVVAKWLFQHGKITRCQALEAEAMKLANEEVAFSNDNLEPRLRARMQDYECAF